MNSSHCIRLFLLFSFQFCTEGERLEGQRQTSERLLPELRQRRNHAQKWGTSVIGKATRCKNVELVKIKEVKIP